jgi:hypothetical protein
MSHCQYMLHLASYGVPLRFTNGVDVDQVTGEVQYIVVAMSSPRTQV